MSAENFPQTLHSGTQRIWIKHTQITNNQQQQFLYTSKQSTPAFPPD